MASVDEINAGFDVAMKGVMKLLVALPDIPFVDEQAVARSELNSKRGREGMVDLVTDVLEAAEKVRARAKES